MTFLQILAIIGIAVFITLIMLFMPSIVILINRVWDWQEEKWGEK
jgi:predicted RND superfamily exporter protein